MLLSLKNLTGPDAVIQAMNVTLDELRSLALLENELAEDNPSG
jgi:hypothetical protein